MKLELSSTQQGMWFHQQLRPNSADLNIGISFTVEGAESSNLERALRDSVVKFAGPALKLEEYEGKPYLTQSEPISIQRISPDQESIEAFRKICFEKPFSLTRESLIRLGVSKLAPQRLVVFICTHHIVSDFFSLAMFVDSTLKSILGVEIQETKLSRTPFEIENAYLKETNIEDHLAHYRDYLGNCRSRLPLPTREHSSPESHLQRFSFDQEIFRNLTSIESEIGISQFSILHGLSHLFMHLKLNTDSHIFGVPATVRGKDVAISSFGNYINVVPIKSDVRESESFLDYLKRLHETTRGSVLRRKLPWPLLLQQLRNAGLDYCANFDVLFNFYDFNTFQSEDVAKAYFGAVSSFNVGPLTITPGKLRVGDAGSRFSFTFCELSNSILGEIKARKSVYSAGELGSLTEGFIQFARAVAESPEVPMVDVLTSKMRPCSVQNILDHVSPSFLDGDILEDEQSVTHSEVIKRAIWGAGELERLGVRTGDVVLVDLDKNIDWLISLLSIWKIGAVYCPLWRNLTKEKKLERGRDVRAAAVISKDLMWKEASLPLLVHYQSISTDPQSFFESLPLSQLAYYFPTSGTTGKPKIVGVSHDGIIKFAEALRAALPVTTSDTLLAFHRPDRDGSIEELLIWACLGTKLVIKTASEVFGVEELFDYVNQHKITLLDLPTSYFVEIVNHIKEASPTIPSCLRTVIIGGENLEESDLTVWKERTKFRIKLVNTYGLTETTVSNTIRVYSRFSMPVPSLGCLLGHTEAILLDDNHVEKEYELGVRGELFLGGPCLASHFKDGCSLSSLRLVTHPRLGVFYKTNDLVECISKGRFSFHGRIDGLVKVAGNLQEVSESIHQMSTRADASLGPVPIPVSPTNDDPMLGRVVEIYQRILGHKNVNVSKSFFDQGGSSLLAIRLISQIQAEFQIKLGYQEMYAHSSPVDLVSFLSLHNQTYNDLDLQTHLFGLLVKAYESDPNKVALIGEGKEFTFAELLSMATANRALFQTFEQPIMPISDDSRLKEVLAALSVMASNKAYLCFDRRSPTARLEAFLESNSLTMIVTSKEIKCGRSVHPGSLLEAQPIRSVPRYSARPGLLAYTCATSGSSGVPKAVMMTHAGALNTLRDVCRRFFVNKNDVVLGLSPMSFDLSVFDVFGVMGLGGTLVVPDGDDPSYWLRALQRYQITIWNSTPGHMSMFLDLYEEFVSTTLNSLRLILLSGDFLSPELAKRLRSHVPQARIVSLGGATEAGIWSNFHEVREEDYEFIPYGRPLTGQGMEVLNSNGKVCENGEKGEIVISGRSLAVGYYGQEDLTKQAFRTHPLRHEQAYFTGDEGYYLDNGEIAITGRLNQEVKIRGFRVHLGEIETTARAIKGVNQALVAVKEGHGENKLYLYITTNQDIERTQVNTHLEHNLPVHMIPTRVIFLDQFPRTPTGKIDKGALPASEPARRKTHSKLQQQKSKTEIAVEFIFMKVLELEDLNQELDFFSLGGSSLQAARALREIHQKFGLRIPLMAFSKDPTPNALSHIIDSTEMADLERYLPVSRLKCKACEYSIPKTYPERRRTMKRKVLMTGATGSLGPGVVEDLLRNPRFEVILISRNRPRHIANEVKWIKGDLEKDRLGLTDADYESLYEVDSIIHMGAKVNFYSSLKSLELANVRGTLRILDLMSKGKGKVLHYFSTAGVFPYGTDTIYYENDPLPETGKIIGGYAQSKWISEYLVQEAIKSGMDAIIYRPGFVANEAAMQDLAASILKLTFQIRKLPEVPFLLDAVTPDYIAKCFNSIWKSKKSLGRTFHLNNPNPIAVNKIQSFFSSKNIQLDVIAFEDWLNEVTATVSETSDLATLELLRGLTSNDLVMPTLDCSNTVDMLPLEALKTLKRSIEEWLESAAAGVF